MTKHLFTLLVCLFTELTLIAQPQTDFCGTSNMHHLLMQQNPEYKANFEKGEQTITRLLNNIHNQHDVSRGIYTIPVVVHIIHNGESVGTGTNISDAQVISTIQGVNDRWRALLGAGVDMNIEFCLAQTDPNGNATTGIDRINASSVANYQANGVNSNTSGTGAQDTSIRNLSNWDHSKYYNIWVINKFSPAGLAGYAYYPGDVTSKFDGTMILSTSMTYNDITLTHELGHAFYLYHTFEGDGGNVSCPIDTNCSVDGDKVCDTPPHKQNDCASTTCAVSGVMDNSFKNYMSYCFPANNVARFTAGQKQRVLAALYMPARSCLFQSAACTPPAPSLDASIKLAYPNDMNYPVTSVQPLQAAVTVKNTGSTTLSSFNIYYKLDNDAPSMYQWTGSLLHNASVNIVLPAYNMAPGSHLLTCFVKQPNGTTGPDAVVLNDTATANFTYAVTTNTNCQDFESAGSLASLGWLTKPEVLLGWGPMTTACSNKCVGINNFSPANDVTDLADLLSPPFSTTGYADLMVSFKYANAFGYSNLLDTLRLICTDNLGNQTLLWQKGGFDLATTGTYYYSGPWYPSSCSEWRADSVHVCFDNAQELTFKFSAVTGWAHQNIYLDNICFKTVAVPNAGPDTVLPGNTIKLYGNNIDALWSLVSATGNNPTIYDITNPQTTFSGLPCNNYNLQWKYDNAFCSTSYADTVSVSFRSGTVPLTLPFAGVCSYTDSVMLSGGTPAGGYYQGTGITGNYLYPAQTNGVSDTVYYVYTDTTGCTVTGTANVVISPAPVVTLNISPDTLCWGSVYTLTGGLPANGTYSGTGVTGNQVNSAIINNPYYNDTIYYTYTNQYSCSNTASQIVYFYICEGITEPGAGNDLAEVFPDPVADRLYIRTNGVPVRTIRIYNITGQLLQDIHWPADNSINVSGLPSGAYFSEIRIGNEWKKSRWIKL